MCALFQVSWSKFRVTLEKKLTLLPVFRDSIETLHSESLRDPNIFAPFKVIVSKVKVKVTLEKLYQNLQPSHNLLQSLDNFQFNITQ